VHLPRSLQRQEPGEVRNSLATQVVNLEKELISEALRQTRGNQSQAAKVLDTSLRILGYKIKQYGLDHKRFRAAAKHLAYQSEEKSAGEGPGY